MRIHGSFLVTEVLLPAITLEQGKDRSDLKSG